MKITVAQCTLPVNCGTVPVGWAVTVKEWSPTGSPVFAVLAKDCNTQAYTGLLGAVNAVPVVGLASRVVAEEGAKLMDMRFITPEGVDVGGFAISYVNGEIVYPWADVTPDVDLSDIEARLAALESGGDYLTLDDLADYATKTYVTTNSALNLQQPGVVSGVVSTYTRSTGYTSSGIILTANPSIYNVPAPSTDPIDMGLTVLKTVNNNGAILTCWNPLQKVGAMFGFSDSDLVNTGFYTIGVRGFAYGTQSIGVQGYALDSNGNPQAYGNLGMRDEFNNVWAGYFQGNVKINGNATLVGTATGWPDFVLEPTYNLPAFEDRVAMMRELKHLRGLPSAEAVGREGIDIVSMFKGLVQNIEELYLYLEELYDRGDRG